MMQNNTPAMKPTKTLSAAGRDVSQEILASAKRSRLRRTSDHFSYRGNRRASLWHSLRDSYHGQGSGRGAMGKALDEYVEEQLNKKENHGD